MTLKIKKEYARVISGSAVACVHLFMTKGTRDNATTRINGPFVAASSGAASRVALDATSIPNCGRQRALRSDPLGDFDQTWINLIDD